MKNQKLKVLDFEIGRAKHSALVEQSTRNDFQPIDSSLHTTDMSLYKKALAYAELKIISGYKDVSVRSEYEFLSQETKRNS